MSAPVHTGVTLIVGPANSGKIGHVLEWWQQRLPLRPVVVLPTGPDARETSAEMAHRAGALVGQSPAVTFDGLVRLVLKRPLRYATDLERVLVVLRLLGAHPLEALAGAGPLPARAASLAALLQQLADSGKTPEQLDGILRRWAQADRGAAPLAADLRHILGAYTQACARSDLTDRSAALRQAVAAAAGWSRPIALYGFTSLTPGQRDLVEQLARHTEVLMAFTRRGERGQAVGPLEESAWWEARAIEVVQAAPHARSYASAAIAHLQRCFMSDEPGAGLRAEPPEGPGAEPRADGGAELGAEPRADGGAELGAEPGAEVPPAVTGIEGVRFLLASGRRAEAELAAEKIAELLRAGFRPGNIGVVVRQVRAWSGLLGDVFDSCAIKYQMDDRRLLKETGLGHALLSALRGVAFDDPGALLSYLRSPYSGTDLEVVGHLELRYRRGTARGAGSLAALAKSEGCRSLEPLWKLVSTGAAAGKGAAAPERAGQGAARPAPCGLGAAGAPAALAGGAAAPALDLGEASTLARRMLVAGARGTAAGSRELEEDARAYRAVQAALAAIAGRHTDDGEAEAIDIQTAVRLLAQVEVSGAGADEGDAVQILSAQRARARRFDAVIVLGLVEGEFPGRPDRPSLLSAAQRARLDQVGGGLFAPEPDQEAALFVSAASRARLLLFLSARDSEDDGSDAVPSHFWYSAKTLLGVGPGDHESRTLADMVFAPTVAPTLRHYLRGCAVRGVEPASAGVGAAVPAGAPPWQRPGPGLLAPAVLSELASLEYFSPSALESYAACPFVWFVERVVGIEDVDLDLDALAIGSLLHSVLSATYRELARRALLPLRPESIPVAEQVAYTEIDEAVTGERCPGTSAQRRVAAWRLKAMARNLLAGEARGGSPLVLSETETWVGDPQGVDIGGIRIRGRIDRVDAAPAGDALFVIDYKSGGIPAASTLGTEEGLQLPLYLMALAAEHPEADVIGGAYLSAADGRRSGVIQAGWKDALGPAADGCRPVDQAAAAELFEQTRQVAKTAADGMRTGVIAPKDDRQCRPWCSLGAACRARKAGYRP